MAIPISAQLTMSWDGTCLRTEGASDNGTRARVAICFTDLPQALRDWLATRLLTLQDRESAKFRALQTKNIQYVAIDLHAPHKAAEIWGEQRVKSALRYSHPSAGNMGGHGARDHGASTQTSGALGRPKSLGRPKLHQIIDL